MDVKQLGIVVAFGVTSLIVTRFLFLLLRNMLGNKQKLSTSDQDKIIKFMKDYKVNTCAIKLTKKILEISNRDVGIVRRVKRSSLFGRFTEERIKK